MFTVVWTLILTAAWSILYFLTVRCERKRYNELYKQCLKINAYLNNAISINTELKAENRELKTKLKEQAIGEIRGKKGD